MGSDDINSFSWMKNIPDFLNIKDINIPGAHNASTKFCQFGLFSCCQKLSVIELLNIGVRALDLRVDGENMVHSFTACKKSFFGKALKIHDVIEDIINFLECNPSETVIVFFKNDGKTDGNTCLDILKKIIEKNPDKWYLENSFPVLSEVRGKIILLNRINSSIGIDFSGMPYQGGTKNSFAEDFSPNGKDTVTVQDRYALSIKRKWFDAVEPILKCENNYKDNLILNHLSTAGMPFIPRFNSAFINRKFAETELKRNGNYGILMLDFQSRKTAGKIIDSNF